MEQVVLKAQKREVIGKQVKALRRQGLLPAIVYGRGFDPTPISLDSRDASRILQEISSSHLIVVDVDGKQHNALVRDKQRDPVTGNIIHVDFMEVSMTETLRTAVPVELVGESPVVEERGGILVAGLEELEVECYPADLPESIRVDISVLKDFGDAIYVKDISVSSKVEILAEMGEMIVLITTPMSAEEEEGVEVEAVEPEVVERGRREEEE